MVGILGLGSRNSSSSEMRPSGASLSVASRKSDAPTLPPKDMVPRSTPGRIPQTSEKQPYSFSLPVWTRRMRPASSRKNFSSPSGDEHGMVTRTAPIFSLALNRDKDLPPSPPLDRDTARLSSDNAPAMSPPSDRKVMKPNCRPPHNDSLPSTTAQVAPSGTSRRQPNIHINIDAKSSVDPCGIDSTYRPPGYLRPSRSAYAFHSSDVSFTGLLAPTETRSRVVSLAAFPANKKKTAPNVVERGSPSSPLTRRPSFLSRKTPNSIRSSVPLESPSPPVGYPSSPSQFGVPPVSNAVIQQSHPVTVPFTLTRRHSEKLLKRPATSNGDVPTLPGHQLRTCQSSSTANPFLSSPAVARRPATAETPARIRSQSFFPLSFRPNASKDSAPKALINLFSSSGVGSGSSSPTVRSPRPSVSHLPPETLKPQADESPDAFLQRLMSLVCKADIAGILASSAEGIYVDSLKSYINRFSFFGDPLDVALRRLLMDVGLPRETQQIDRVIEAFSSRYTACNPDLFSSPDHPYILAFSLIMLHTDAFNKSNRRKMSKADYVKNTSLPGLMTEILDCFYDNVVFAPFIFIEDPLDSGTNGIRRSNGGNTRPCTPATLPSPLTAAATPLLSKAKIDPYYLIINNLLDQLRVKVEEYVPTENPFSWNGTGVSWDYDEILLAFSKALVVAISSSDGARLPTVCFGLSIGSSPSPSAGKSGGISSPYSTPNEIWNLRVVKVAVLNRRDDVAEGGKRPVQRKWRPYSVVLTRSQLLLFRDISWAAVLLSWDNTPKPPPLQAMQFKPDEVIPIKDALAVFDRSYTKHTHTFRLTISDGRHILFQAQNEREMNAWISYINYASAFNSTGIRMRSLRMSGEDADLTETATSPSYLQDLQFAHPSRSRASGLQTGSNVDEVVQLKEICNAVEGVFAGTHTDTDEFTVDVEGFSVSSGDLRASNFSTEPSGFRCRAQIIHSAARDLEDRICTANSQMDGDLRVVRNIAILAPFQKSTRDRLQDAVQTLSRRLQTLRLDVTKLVCHRNILLNDLAAETRIFRQRTASALQATMETLHNGIFESMPSPATFQDIGENSPQLEDGYRSVSNSFDSSSAPSSRTALDLGPNWPSSGEAFTISAFRAASFMDESSNVETHGTPTSQPLLDEDSHSSASAQNQLLSQPSLQEKPSFSLESREEQAEDWDKTRAAKRVSLVRLPSDLRLVGLRGKLSRHPSSAGDSGPQPSLRESPP
ncbi:hypothetical protein EV401DRAFT_1915771 [Pisolithus croceorrhizus]|nr:hypothetical protein EV401DRAFT_1915771 [Pisolithus croceorrhizus]